VSYSFIYAYTQWLEDGRGLSASGAGLATLPLFATGIVVSLITGRHTQVRGKLAVAAVGQIIGCALLLTLHAGAAIWLLLVVALVFGIPQGLNSLALQNSVYRQANPDDIGASAGLLRTFGYLGAIIASAAQGAFYGRAASTGGMHHLALLLIGVGVAFLLITVFDRSLTRSTNAKELPHV
jgi:MFS-type transporter involved in bile tolerance (Atg22 family)